MNIFNAALNKNKYINNEITFQIYFPNVILRNKLLKLEIISEPLYSE